ncbi:hypothetical protein [Streptomyces sp. BA2]|nr:hypothetical protein [Streptomyces sp. BA2]MWA15118.1 hypothetical protein [Streptomyces sp. BA2]
MNQPLKEGQLIGLLAAAHSPTRGGHATLGGVAPAVTRGSQCAGREAESR